MIQKLSRLKFVAIAPALVFAMSAPGFAAGAEVVQFRLTEWRSQHFEDPAKAKQVHDSLAQLGCEAKTDNHGGHIDVTYRCPEWRSLQAATHDSAHSWETWLKQAGFETSHKH